MIHELSNTINRHPPVNTSDHYRILAGSSRLALETRNENRKACVYCGECMLGCPSEAIWSADREFHRYQASRFISSYIVCRVRYVKDRRVYYQVRGEESAGDINAGPFDLIYIAAGCIGSTEIVMRSLGISQGPQMLDTALLTFPIFYAGREGGLGGGGDRYFSLCNLSMIGIPSDPAEAVAQVSVYPAFDHLWRYYTPDWLWGLMQNVWRIGRWRLMLGRVYLTDAANRTFNFELKDDRLVIHRGPSPDISSSYRLFMNSLRQATNHSGFYIPPIPPIGHGTSSHYAGTLPYGDNLVSVPRHGRIAPGVHIADATTFPALPAISPTFTIMANACRTAHESLLD
jgi:ferredoxin